MGLLCLSTCKYLCTLCTDERHKSKVRETTLSLQDIAVAGDEMG